MHTRNFSLLAGMIYLIIGVLGFFPNFRMLPPDHAPHLVLENSYGYLFGLFPINLLHNLVHIVLGLWGLMAFRNEIQARRYARSLAVIYGVLAVMGFIPFLKVTGGLIPLFGHDIWLHAVTAVVAAYFGFVDRISTDAMRASYTDKKGHTV